MWTKWPLVIAALRIAELLLDSGLVCIYQITPDVTLPNVLDLDALGSKALNSKAQEYQVLESCRHNKKLRRGMHQANSFVIRLRQVQGDREVLERAVTTDFRAGCAQLFW